MWCRLRPSAFGLLLLLTVSPIAWAADGCTIESKDTSASIACTSDIPELAPDGNTWEAALEGLDASASTASVKLSNITFDPASFQRMVSLVVGLGALPSMGTVDVEIKQCSMRDAQVDLVASAALPASTQYSFTLNDCKFVRNSVNATGLLAAQDSLDVALRLLGTDVSGNTLLAAGGIAVGATAKAAITLAESSSVSNNTAVLIGLLFAGGDGGLTVQLASSNVTDNSLEQMGAVALGGNATADITGADEEGTTLEGNTLQSRVMLFDEEPLIVSLTDILMGLTFDEPTFNLSAALTEAHGRLCAALSSINMTAAGTEMPASTAAQVGSALMKISGALCDGASPASDFSLASIAPALEAALSGSTSSNLPIVAAVEGVLESLLGGAADGKLEALVGGLLNGTMDVGTALDELLATLLSSPAGDAAASAIADALTQLGEWLDRPIGGAGGGSPPGGDKDDDSSEGGADLGSVIADLIGSIGGSGDGGDAAAPEVVADVAALVQNLIDTLAGGGDGTTTPEDLLSQIIAAATGGKDSPLAGVDLSALIPILRAVVADPAARQQLPGLLQTLLSGGKLDLGALGPLVSAVLGDPQAAAGLPALMGLLGKLGLQM